MAPPFSTKCYGSVVKVVSVAATFYWVGTNQFLPYFTHRLVDFSKI